MNNLRSSLACLLILAFVQTLAYAGETGSDWSLYGYTFDNKRFSPLNQVNTATVKSLGLEWKFNTGKIGSFQTSPLVINGVMYLTTPFNDVIALDAKNGEMLWRYKHKLTHNNYCCGPANRGAAVSNGRVYTVTVDARLIALDQDSGDVIWDRKIVDVNADRGEVLEPLLGVEELKGAIQTGQTGYSANLAPQVYKDKIFVGITGAGYGLHINLEEKGEDILSVGGLSGGVHGLRGFLVAYDQQSGDELWRWYSVPEQGWHGKLSPETDYGENLNRRLDLETIGMKKYRDTWRYGGGSIYTTPAIDEKRGLIYIGTGNPSPQMDDSTRPGDNLHTVSLVALELETGKLRWYYQQVPHDRWGYDVASPPVLFTTKHNGRNVDVVGQASKLGWFFIHDRETGELIRRSQPFVPQENLFARPDEKGVRIVPGTLGAASWSPVAYHERLNYVYIPGIYQPSLFYSRKLEPAPGKPWGSYTFFRKSAEQDWGLFSAVNTSTGEIAWQKKTTQPMVGGALATAGDLVFTGEGDGHFTAYHAGSGELLWTYKASYGVNAPPVTYMVDSEQYIAVAAGGNKLFGYSTGDEVLVFKLQ